VPYAYDEGEDDDARAPAPRRSDPAEDLEDAQED
jgi:hypothetical protein